MKSSWAVGVHVPHHSSISYIWRGFQEPGVSHTGLGARASGAGAQTAGGLAHTLGHRVACSVTGSSKDRK